MFLKKIQIDLSASTTILCFLVLLAPLCVTASQQKITFYEQPNCVTSGKSETITNTNSTLGNTWLANANSTLIVGVWKMSIRNTTNGASNQLSFTGTNPPNGRCINKSTWPVAGWQNHTITNATRFGPADMTTSQVLLYTGVDFTGTLHTINGDSNNLGSIQVRSYAHFSNDTWTLFSQTLYNGTTTYLRPSSATVRDSFVVQMNVNYPVGSVRKGQHNVGTTTTPRPTTTTTRPTTTTTRPTTTTTRPTTTTTRPTTTTTRPTTTTTRPTTTTTRPTTTTLRPNTTTTPSNTTTPRNHAEKNSFTITIISLLLITISIFK